MSSTKRFAWQNRHTAARDLLQLAYVAPESIRGRALQLLKAFRSETILPDLVQIVMDEERDVWERRYAVRAIASIPGDIYLPEFARFGSTDDQLSFNDLTGLISKHPSNLQWAFTQIEKLQPQEYLDILYSCTWYFYPGKGLSPVLCQRIIGILELNPLLLNIKLTDTLYNRDGSEPTLKWLRERWDTLIYLCLVQKMDEAFILLESWDELREAVFKNCPAIIEEYEQKKQEIETIRLQHRPSAVDYQSSLIWQELNEWYESAAAGNQNGYGKLTAVVYHERDNLSKRAVATNLLGKLKDKYDVRAPLFHVLRYAPDDEKYNNLAMNTSIRFEAGEALRDIPSPDVWETMIDAFFIRPRNVLESFMSDWIAYLTDRLSGIDTPYSGKLWGDENKRFWFRALAAGNTMPDQETLI